MVGWWGGEGRGGDGERPQARERHPCSGLVGSLPIWRSREAAAFPVFPPFIPVISASSLSQLGHHLPPPGPTDRLGPCCCVGPARVSSSANSSKKK